MAKLVLTYEDQIEKRELTFRGQVFDFSMIPEGCGIKRGDKKGLDTQVEKAFPELANDDELMELIDQLNCEDHGCDICDLLDELEPWECGHE